LGIAEGGGTRDQLPFSGEDEARLIEALSTGTIAPPAIYLKVKVCERMGWTFTEYYSQPADEVSAALHIWSLERRLEE
jgi:hypothetical protein